MPCSLGCDSGDNTENGLLRVAELPAATCSDAENRAGNNTGSSGATSQVDDLTAFVPALGAHGSCSGESSVAPVTKMSVVAPTTPSVAHTKRRSGLLVLLSTTLLDSREPREPTSVRL
jgi:hypothetical protein